MRDPIPVTMILFPEVLMLDVAGPLQVFSSANSFVAEPFYRVRTISEDGRPVTSESGIALMVDAGFDAALPGGDLFTPGGPGIDRQCANPAMVQFLREAAPNQRRVASVCSGSLLLAEAGLLDGRKATCHWGRTPDLWRRYPAVRWLPDEIYTRDANIFTSAGVTAGIDLALAMVEDDLGCEIALEVARELVVYMRRSGGQSQYSRPLQAQSAASPRIKQLCEAIVDQPAQDWRVTRMSEYANMTERSLHRLFIKEFGESPSRFVEGVRVDYARNALEQSPASYESVAALSGFRDAQTLRRAFAKHLGVTPATYRFRFQRAG
ncbi:GlxA family transcriptional regulator [Pelagibius sp. Alg239-R121]|uniref:GlxA family transcriptional regulator n=1 Tax=Pelagibius sp. Alg239-R121 TaxID=2993448 RepID=UPI0024A74D54|nr:GlxA family transcriptional regulator [Pelagibius sp. Alg239-R121]